jgi:hypothetical protein
MRKERTLMNLANMLIVSAAVLSVTWAAPVSVNDQNIGSVTSAPESSEAVAKAAELVDVNFTKAQIQEIRAAFARFPSFETPYAPRKMAASDRYQRTVAGEDGVAMIFDHMRLKVSPRDYSDPSQGTAVTLPNGTAGRWYTADQAAGMEPRLVFPVDDRFVTIHSPDRTLSQAVLEGIAATVAKL